jgi:hypothetical protein
MIPDYTIRDYPKKNPSLFQVYVKDYSWIEGIEFWKGSNQVKHPLSTQARKNYSEIQTRLLDQITKTRGLRRVYNFDDLGVTVDIVPKIKVLFQTAWDPDFLIPQAFKDHLKFPVGTTYYTKTDYIDHMKYLKGTYQMDNFYKYSQQSDLVDERASFAYNFPISRHPSGHGQLLSVNKFGNDKRIASYQRPVGTFPTRVFSPQPRYPLPHNQLPLQYDGIVAEYTNPRGQMDVLMFSNPPDLPMSIGITKMLNYGRKKNKLKTSPFPTYHKAQYVLVMRAKFYDDENARLDEIYDIFSSMLSERVQSHLLNKGISTKGEEGRNRLREYFGTSFYLPEYRRDKILYRLLGRIASLKLDPETEHSKIDKLMGFVDSLIKNENFFITPGGRKSLLGYRLCTRSTPIKNGMYTIRNGGQLESIIHWVVLVPEYWDVSGNRTFDASGRAGLAGVYITVPNKGGLVGPIKGRYLTKDGEAFDEAETLGEKMTKKEFYERMETQKLSKKVIRVFRKKYFYNEELKLNNYNRYVDQYVIIKGTVRINGIKKTPLLF